MKLCSFINRVKSTDKSPLVTPSKLPLSSPSPSPSNADPLREGEKSISLTIHSKGIHCTLSTIRESLANSAIKGTTVYVSVSPNDGININTRYVFVCRECLITCGHYRLVNLTVNDPSTDTQVCTCIAHYNIVYS